MPYRTESGFEVVVLLVAANENGVISSTTNAYVPAFAGMNGRMSRLASLVHNASGTANDVTFGYSYNPASQITGRTVSNAAYKWGVAADFSDAYTDNSLNQITSVDGAAFTHDAPRARMRANERPPVARGEFSVCRRSPTGGNTTDDAAKTYSYDADNRMTASGTGVQAYDPLGRLYRLGSGTETRFLYSGSQIVAEYNQSNVLQRRFVPGGQGAPLVWLEGTGTGARKWLLADERGSIVAHADAAAAVTQINRYDPYGVPDAGNSGRFRYAGAPWIAAAGLYHLRARNYSPDTGRFMQPDPIRTAGGMNLYAYVGDDPVNFTDPFGLDHQACSSIDGGAPFCFPRTHDFGLGSFNFGGGGGSFAFAGDRGSEDAEGGQSQCSTANALLGPEAAAALAAVADDSLAAIAGRVLTAIASRLSPAAAFAATLGGSTASDDMPQPQYVLRGGVATPQQLMAGVSDVSGYPGLTGFSVSSGPGLSVEQIALIANYPHKQISVTTVGLLAGQGVLVAPTPLPGQPLHHTVLTSNPLDPVDAARISTLFKQMLNPAQCK